MAVNLRAVGGIGKKFSVGPALRLALTEPPSAACAEPLDEIIDVGTVALHLDHPVEPASFHGWEKFCKPSVIGFLLGKSRVPRKFDEFIEITGEALDERFRPGQTDQ